MVGRDEKRKERDRDTERKKHGVQKTNARNFEQFCFVFVRSLFPGISRAFFCTPYLCQKAFLYYHRSPGFGNRSDRRLNILSQTMKKWIRVADVRGRAERYVCDHAGEKKRFQNGVWTASFEKIAQI